jgi:hypothetical protein
VRVIALNATCTTILAISCQSDLLVEETGVPRENPRPVAILWQTLSDNVVLSTLRHERLQVGQQTMLKTENLYLKW